MLVLKVRNCRLEILSDEFVEKVTPSVSAMSLLIVASVLFFMSHLRAAGWIFPEIFLSILQIVLVEKLS